MFKPFVAKWIDVVGATLELWIQRIVDIDEVRYVLVHFFLVLFLFLFNTISLSHLDRAMMAIFFSQPQRTT